MVTTEPRPPDRPSLIRPRLAAGGLLLAAAVALAAVATLQPDPVARLNQTPSQQPILILLAAALGAAVALVARPWLTPQRLEHAAGWVFAGAAALLALMSLLSLGRFMTIDLPDEPWLAATAVNYAVSGSLVTPERAWVYAITEPVLQRYYLLMGLWLRALDDSSLLALRAFPLLIGSAAAALTALLLWKTPDLRRTARWGGLAALLAFTPFVRASHHLRADIGLAIYGAVLLWALIGPPRPRRALLAGLVLWIGMETVPTTALTVAVTAGVLLLKSSRRSAAVYAAGGLIALALYALRFLPDPAGSLLRYAAFIRYYDQTGLLGLRWPLDLFFGYHLRFGLIWSPAEILLFALALVGLWQGARSAALVVAAGGLLMLSGFTVSYGYWAVFAPFVAYGTALALRRPALLAMALVLLPAAALAPLRDMAAATAEDANATVLAQMALMTGQFPPGSVVVGDEVLWFSLHYERTFIGWVGLERFAEVNRLSLTEALTVLETDAAVCNDQQTARCAQLRRSPLFAAPLRFRAAGQSYWIFRRQP